MSENGIKGLITVAWKLITDCPWVVIGALPFWDRMRVKKSTMISWIILVNASYLILIFITTLVEPLSTSRLLTNTIVPILYYLAIAIFYLIGFDVHWSKFLYMFLFIFAASSLVNNVAYIIAQLIMGKGVEISMTATPLYSGLMALFNLIMFPLIIRFLRRTLRPMLSVTTARDTLTLCALPILFFLVGNFNYAMYSLYLYPLEQFLFNAIFMQVCWLASFFLNIRITQEGGKRAKIQAEKESIAQMVELQQRSYIQLTENIAQTKTMRHDMRFHLSLVTGYMKDGQYEKVLEHLEEYNRSFEEKSMASVCSHYAVDVLAKHFLGQMKELGVKTDARLSLPVDIGIADADLCVVFGNLFENALHSLEKQEGETFFTARCVTDQSSVIITMDNSCENELNFMTGIGLSSVKSIAEKYGGVSQFECEDGEFHASVMLNIPDSDALLSVDNSAH